MLPIHARMLPALIVLLSLMGLPVAVAEEVTVMSYNLENAFDVFDDPYTGDESTDAKRSDEMVAIAKAIASADPDIVVVQELENQAMLEGLVRTFLSDAGYDYIACDRGNDGRGINLGIISRYPIRSITSYRHRTLTHPDAPDRTWRFSRDAMQITLDVNGQRLDVINVHLKSNSSSPGDENSKLRRTAEAIMVKSIIREMTDERPDAYVLLMGDINSNLEERPEQPRPWPATAHLRAPESDGSQLLHDAHDALSFDERITIPGRGRYPGAVFDYIYASSALHQNLIAEKSIIVNDPDLVSGSDHYPVVATYKIGD
ncbi:MAG: endonuclease/exonuclease/phosphatase family protein [Planctomycetota bacterium]